MHIERIQIEEGFLNGLDIRPMPGLNVVIGARGTGKTSLIELIRFCLGVEGFTPEATRRSREHALSVLGTGQVILSLVDGERRITVSRSANEVFPRASDTYPLPIILSQTEIETVGLQPGGRLRLLDGFVNDQLSNSSLETEATAAIRSITAEARAIRGDLDQLTRQISELPNIERELFELAPREQEVASLSANALERTGQLNAVTNTVSIKGVAGTAIDRFRTMVAGWRAALAQAQTTAVPEAWPTNAGADPLGELRTRAGNVYHSIGQALQELALIEIAATQLSATTAVDKISHEDSARQLRRDIESLQAGAGQIVRRGAELRERREQLASLRAVLAARTSTLMFANGRRASALDHLEQIRTARFEARLAAANQLNAVLGPRIKIDVKRAGQTDVFAAALAEALRGSGLRYNDFVEVLAKRISPRELLEAVEADDYELISTRGAMSYDRAAKASLALKEADLGAIATVPIEDDVRLCLLDGSDYKEISELSTGQRCTVILPLVLRHVERLLIVDQPEDHIDNAFITDTLIKAILARPTSGQLIFSTHNANIPVLGNADFVIEMGSDGRRGFPLVAAPLLHPRVIGSISTVMEGGAKAFQTRASFYNALIKA